MEEGKNLGGLVWLYASHGCRERIGQIQFCLTRTGEAQFPYMFTNYAGTCSIIRCCLSCYLDDNGREAMLALSFSWERLAHIKT